MGDAGPSTPPPALQPQIPVIGSEHETSLREVTVLVTGFGPFKSFSTNPSFLIASALPQVLPSQKSSLQTNNTPSPYRIRLLLYPSPIRVSYATIASLVPTLIQQHNPDYIFHIGMAGGRDHYTLETIAHRDNYKIKDVDERDGWKEGEYAWKRDGVPDKLHVGWDEGDVAERWDREVREREEALGLAEEGEKVPRTGLTAMRFGEWGRHERKKVKSVCKLSVDAGRFLCEFTLFESLAHRWLQASQGSETNMAGKVAFLHVPGAFDAEAVERGVRVAEAAIKSLVASWEEGRRRVDGQEKTLVGSGKMESGRWDGVVWKG